MCDNNPEYAEESGRKAWLWAGFKLKKDIERMEYWPNYSRETLPECVLLRERNEFEEWYKEYEGE